MLARSKLAKQSNLGSRSSLCVLGKRVTFFIGLAQEVYQNVLKVTALKKNTNEDYAAVTSTAQQLFDVFDQYSPLAQQMLNRNKVSKKEPKAKGKAKAAK